MQDFKMFVSNERNFFKTGKIMAYLNKAIPDDCVAAFTGAYEKIAGESQIKRVDVEGGIPDDMEIRDISSMKQFCFENIINKKYMLY